MKKLLLVFMFSFTLALGFAATATVQAEEGDVELYPYDKIACLEASSECTNTKVGDAHWDVNYNGYNYNVVRGNVRFAVDFDDANSDGLYDVTEYESTSWSSFGGLFINDTASEVVIDTANLRGDTSGNSTPRIWVYYNELGEAVMYEDNYINKYDIFNDGTELAPDWRMATETEVAAYTTAETAVETAEAAEVVVLADGTSTQVQIDAAAAAVLTAETAFDTIKETTMIQSLIRIADDAVDSDGYVLEPLASLKWYKAGTDTTVVTDETLWSDIITDTPNNVVIPAGWSVFYFGYLDRSGANAKTLDYTDTFAAAIVAGDVAGAVITYDDQPGWFTGMGALDEDPIADGVNVIVEFNGTFTMPITVGAEWLNMFDDTTDKIINTNEILNFKAEISDETGVIETIDYTWNATTEVYDINAEQTVIDSSEFGAGYIVEFMATTPELDTFSYTIDVGVGVVPPRFENVKDRYIDENTYIGLMDGITANDGYGNDLTSTVELTTPEGFNMYSPVAGEYTMELEFTHNIFIPGYDGTVTLDTVVYNFDGSTNVTSTDWRSQIIVYTDATNLKTVSFSWGSAGVVIEVAADGTVIRTANRRTWNLVDETHLSTEPGDASGMFVDWIADLDLSAGGTVIIVGASTGDAYTAARALNFGDVIDFNLDSLADFDFDIITTESYVLTVDDTTAPQALVLNNDYMIEIGEYSVIDDAILANVAAFDFFDASEDLSVYVSNNGGLVLATAGTYTVEVTVEDEAGNSDMVSFDVVVVAPEVTTADVVALLDNQTLTDAEITALVDAAILAAVPEVIEETGCGSSMTIGTSIVLAVAALGGIGFLALRRKY